MNSIYEMLGGDYDHRINRLTTLYALLVMDIDLKQVRMTMVIGSYNSDDNF